MGKLQACPRTGLSVCVFLSSLIPGFRITFKLEGATGETA